VVVNPETGKPESNIPAGYKLGVGEAK
jgi:hypothetical protein